jgi:hypothetical protein
MAAIATASDKNKSRRIESLHRSIISSLATISGIKRVTQVCTEPVISAKAEIQNETLGPRLRGEDELCH